MPDITMCMGGDCPMKQDCHRYTAKPTPLTQTYFAPPFSLMRAGDVAAIDTTTEEGRTLACRYYWSTVRRGA